MTGTTLSHYRLIERLGEGATAVVYKAEDLALGRLVALKLLPQAISVDLGKIARFQHEARTTSTLSHPNICTIYEIDQHEGRHFIAMEYLDGRPLSKVIDNRPVEGYRLIELAIQIADGLDAAHEARVIHRDLKPANIYVTDRDHIKLLDFGLATLMPARDALKSASSAAWLSEPGGTGPYMSPEQTLGEPLDTRSDLFSLGVVLYEMATGARPFTGHTHAALVDAIRGERPFPARDMNTDVREELDRIINKALEKNRKLRYQTASDLSADLRRLKRDIDAGVPLPTRPLVVATVPEPAPPALIETSPRRGSGATPWMAAQLVGAATVGAILVALGLPHARTTTTTTGMPDAPTPAAGRGVTGPAGADVSALNAPPAAEAETVEEPRPAAEVAPRAEARPAGATPVGVASPAVVLTDPVAAAVRIAQEKTSLELHDQALDTLREALRTNAASPAAPAAYLLMGSIHERRGQFDDAIGSYLDVQGRFPSDGLAPQALFNMAGATLKSRQAGKEAQAARIYTDVAGRYPSSPWAARALMARAELEGRRRTAQFDATLGRTVPAALVTYRAIVQDHPRSAEREHALWRLSDLYVDLKRYDLAAFTLRDLASAYPSTTYDAWFAAAELFHKRLNDRTAARSAYAQVPGSSPNWSDAQKRLAIE